MLVSMKEMLADAREKHYAIPAFDVSNFEMLKSVLEACEEAKSPALLQVLGVDLQGRNLPMMTAMAQKASELYQIPVCLHLDHATDFAFIQKASEAGFSSVMFDGSVLPFAENAGKTKEIVDYAHARGITVEAELGHVGNAMVGNEQDTVCNEDPEDTLTLPQEVVEFVSITDVDALAIAIGTAHGVYKKTPTLRIDRLDEITAVCDRPLVLHGGSGTPDAQMQQAIAHGITKINIYSDIVAAMNGALKEKLNAMENPATWPAYVFEDARNQIKHVVHEKCAVFGSANRV